MIRRLFLTVLFAGALAGAAAAQVPPARDIVAQAKAAGQVGEQADGYLGLVSDAAPATVKTAVAEINAGRTKAYQDIAAKSGVTVQAAGEATARQLFDKMAPGAWYKPLGGGWTRK
jgi:uncharacterized protein